MVAREHRVSRRVLLGAACALPLTRHPGPSTPLAAALRINSSRGPDQQAKEGWTPDRVRGDDRWRKALAVFRRAQTVIDAAVHEPDQDRYDALLDTFSRPLRRLLRTPAPDLPALSVKLHLAIDQAAWESSGGEASMAALKRDARRLSRS